MSTESKGSGPLPARLGRACAAAIFAAICLGPHADRLRHPSLFTDDATRVGDLQARPLHALLFRPFQEHMAPLFETVSWATWSLAGRRLVDTPLAFTLASYVPFLLCLGMVGLVIRRETGSPTTALATVAAFSLSSLHCEVIYWYSASSFTWALLWAIVAMDRAAATARGGGRSALIGAAAASFLAPACSAIGLLAGPLAAIRVATDPGIAGRRRAAGLGLIPLLGTAANLAACALFRYQDILASSLERRADFSSGLIYALCAPANVLVPGLIGLNAVEFGPMPWPSLAVAAVGLAGILTWAACQPRHRPLILGGLWLVLGGYVMTYCFRTERFGAKYLFRIERYHLFPLFGFLGWMALASRRWLARYDHRPLASLVAASAVAAVLMATHLPMILAHSAYYRFPGQRRTLAAVDRLDRTCQGSGITAKQAVDALGPIRVAWSQFDYLGLLLTGSSKPSLPDTLVRPTLLAALSAEDREALWGGMDVSPFIATGPIAPGPGREAAVGHLVDTLRITTGPGGRAVAGGGPAYLEYTIDDRPADGPGTLQVPAAGPRARCEVWWAGEDGGWSEGRSVRWEVGSSGPRGDLAIPLDRLPHWESARPRRVRVIFRNAGAVTLDAPKILR